VANYDPIYAPHQERLNGRYDFIVCTEVAEHLHKPDDTFQQLRDMLITNGVLAVMTSWLNEDIDFHRWHYRRDPTHVCFYQKQTFEWLAENLKYQILLLENNIALFRRTRI